MTVLVTASSSTTLTTTTITTNNHDMTNNRKFVFNILFVNMFLNFLTVRLHIRHKHEPVSLPLQPQCITTSCHVTTSPQCLKATNDEQCHRDTYANEWENGRGSRDDASQAPGILFYFIFTILMSILRITTPTNRDDRRGREVDDGWARDMSQLKAVYIFFLFFPSLLNIYLQIGLP
jgi:hypothetical protein